MLFGKINFNVNLCDRINNELVLHLTQECPNNCCFCIDKLNKKYDYKGKPDFAAIKQAILNYKEAADAITISGGEPLIYIKEVLDLVKFIKERTSMKIIINTSIPIECYDNKEVFDELVDNVDIILFSAHHYDQKMADIIRHSRSLFNRDKFYREIKNKDKFIVSLNVYIPHLCNKEQILRCIEYYYNMGFNNIKLAELFDRDSMYVSIAKVLGLKLKIPFAQGCSNKNVDISKLLPKFKGNLTIKTVCFIRNKKLNVTIWDFLKTFLRNLFKHKKYFFGVIYPDGKIYPYWL
jgi:organic radical activating enzyme